MLAPYRGGGKGSFDRINPPGMVGGAVPGRKESIQKPNRLDDPIPPSRRTRNMGTVLWGVGGHVGADSGGIFRSCERPTSRSDFAGGGDPFGFRKGTGGHPLPRDGRDLSGISTRPLFGPEGICRIWVQFWGEFFWRVWPKPTGRIVETRTKLLSQTACRAGSIRYSARRLSRSGPHGGTRLCGPPISGDQILPP